MERKLIEQSFKGKIKDKFELAQKYYTLFSAITNLKLTEREIQLIAYTAIHGNISYSTTREEFINTFKTSSATINNMVSKLKKQKVFIKDGSKVKVNPQLILDFDNDLHLKITMLHG
jgi:ribosomal protein L25 (general stress protein Ctc)